ncbi:hypothetical protein OSTOST_04171, partial [Ostertagia ostertagi]
MLFRLRPLKGVTLPKILTRHSTYLGGLMRDARKKILRNFHEVAVLSPVFITPLKDGVTPAFQFTYNPPVNKFLGGKRNPLLFTYLAVNRQLVSKISTE